MQSSTSNWLPVPAGVPQGSVLGPLLFLAYTIDLPNCVLNPTQCDQFADDTALTTVTPSAKLCEQELQQSVCVTSTWLCNWRLAVNAEKTVTMAFTRSPFRTNFSINLNGNTLSTVNQQKHLGLILSTDLRWSAHVDKILSKAARLLYTMKRLRCTLSRKALTLYYCQYVRPVVEYACIAWPNLPARLRDRLECFQRRAFKIILRRPLFERSDRDELLLTIGQPSLQSRRQYMSSVLGFQLAKQIAPQHLLKECSPNQDQPVRFVSRHIFTFLHPVRHSTNHLLSTLQHAHLMNFLNNYKLSNSYPSSKEKHSSTSCLTPVHVHNTLTSLSTSF